MVLLFVKVTGIDSNMGLPLRATAQHCDGEALRQVYIGRGEVHAPEHLEAIPQQIVAEHPDRPGTRGHEPKQHREGGRLAGGVGAQEAADRPPLDGEAHPVDGAYLAEALGYPMHLDRRQP